MTPRLGLRRRLRVNCLDRLEWCVLHFVPRGVGRRRMLAWIDRQYRRWAR